MISEGSVRRAIPAVFTFLVCLALQAFAQQGHPRIPNPAAPPAPPVTKTDDVPYAVEVGSPIALNKSWRVGITSDPAAATPGFDDSKWAIRNADEAIADVPGGDESDQPDSHDRRFVWFRMHLKLPKDHPALALLIELPVTQNTTMTMGASGPGINVFVNGKPVQPEGPHGDAPFRYEEISRIYPLNVASSETNVTLAIHTLYVPFGTYAYTSFFSKRALFLGDPQDLEGRWNLWFYHSIFERLPRLVNSVLLTVLSLFLLALYFTQKGHVEYLWLALH